MGAYMFSLLKRSGIIEIQWASLEHPVGLIKILFELSANNPVYLMVVDQAQHTAAPGVQEKLFALHDSLDRLNILHSHLQFP